MVKKLAEKISLNALLVVIALGLLLAWRLNSQNGAAPHQDLELVDVIYDTCFSPNNDGAKDIMAFEALFVGLPKKPIFAVLFIKQNDQLINFRIGMAIVSQEGNAEININWNGKDWRGQNVAAGQYSLLMYYFNIPGLFNQLANQKIEKVLEKIKKRLLQREKNELLKRWNGEVLIDKNKPVLTVTNPSANVSTFDSTWPTEGEVIGADVLTINGSVVTIDNQHFSNLLNLQTGTNTFTYLAEDCAGNRDQQVRSINRLVDNTPPTVTISSPVEGQNYTVSPLAVVATYEDDGSGIDWPTLKVLLNGSDITSFLNIAESGVTGEIEDEALFNDGANTLRLEVSDQAGNLGKASVHFNFEKIAAKDKTFIYGRVLNIADNKPLSGALISASGNTAQSDDQGYWKMMFAEGGTYKIKIGKLGFTEVFRKVTVDKGEEAVSEDAYLTELEAKTTAIGPDGGTHQNSDGSVEIVIPAGALAEVKEIQSTRLAGSKALPGALNATDNLQYPISFLFCADLKPEGTVFAQPVKLRVKNTWGFAAGSQIPFAFWDKNALKWVPAGMATVDANKAWLEAEISHFSSCDLNIPSGVEQYAGTPIFEKKPTPVCRECNIGSNVDVNTGSLQTDFSLPGVKLRGGDTDVTLVYNSTTAYPTAVVSILDYHNNSLAIKPDRTELRVASPLLGGGGGGGGTAAVKALNFNAPTSFGSGAFIFNGVYPSGRTVQTGYQKIDFSFTNFYPGKYAFVANWGGMPTGSTAVLSTEPAYLEDKNEERIFMVSQADSPFGKGWCLANLKKLHFEDNRAVVVEGNGDYREYEYGINYADKLYGASVQTTSHTMHEADKMLISHALNPVKQENCARFWIAGMPAAGTNQYFIIDLGQERDIYQIGIDFSAYWDRINVWDFIRISTSTDNVNYQQWGQYGEPTLKNPAQGYDPLDRMIKSPYFVTSPGRAVRYIKYELGFPSVNTVVLGSGIYRVFAIGSENELRSLGGEKWPKLYLDQPSGNYILEDFSGSQTVFSNDGLMIAEKERSGRTINYKYNGDNLIRISYPENVYMEFIYGAGGKLERVRDSSGRETLINMDQAGNLLEVAYPDNETRQFTYDERGLMTADKKGNAEKKYTWDNRYAVLKEVELPNHGKRILEPWALTNALNDKESNPEQLIDFPFLSGNAMESVVTFEDSRQEKYVTGSGWKWSYENNKLREKITYADLERNQLPVKIEKGEDGWESTEVIYNDELQVSGVKNFRTENRWGMYVVYNPNMPSLPWPGNPEDNFSTSYQNYEYNNQRLVSKVTGSYLILNYAYDDKGNLLQEEKITNALTFLSKFTYNESNDLTKVEYPDGKINEMTYNVRGLVTEVKNNDGTKTVMERDGLGDVIAMVDEENRRVELTRDVMGRVLEEKSPSGKEVQYQWGRAGCSSCGDGSKLTKITDAAGHIWEFKYDIMGNPIEMVYPDSSKITQEYDIAGRLGKFFNKRGQEISYTYNADGKLTKKTTLEGDVDFTYDERERINEIVGNGFHYLYKHGHVGGMGTLWQQEELLSGSLLQVVANDIYGAPINIYDSFGWRKYFLYDSPVLGSSPNEIDYLWKGTQASFMRTTMSHDTARRMTSYKNEMFRRADYFSYDTNGLLKQSRYAGWPGWPYFNETGSLNFSRDTSGLITGITGDRELSTAYDQDLQITSINHILPQPFAESYAYDENGNRITSLINSFTYDDLNRLTESTTHNYEYDADGNMILEKNKLNGEIKKYYYDAENRMIKYEHQASDVSPLDITATYKYDIFGRRLQKTVNNVITNFFWENDTMTYELNESYQPIRKYLTGTGMDNYDGHLEYSEITDWSHIFFPEYNQPWYSYMYDQVGTVYKVHSLKTRFIAESRVYDLFGNLVNQSETTKTPLGFQGKYSDAESGLSYFYHRYYNPAIGRFTSEDPQKFEGGKNFYSFGINNPLNFIDPYGLVIWPPNCGAENLADQTRAAAECLERCLQRNTPEFQLRVTATRNGTHAPGSRHYTGDAFDTGFNSNPGLRCRRQEVENCYYECFPINTYAQEENTHFHFQMEPGRGGASGFAPGVN